MCWDWIYKLGELCCPQTVRVEAIFHDKMEIFKTKYLCLFPRKPFNAILSSLHMQKWMPHYCLLNLLNSITNILKGFEEANIRLGASGLPDAYACAKAGGVGGEWLSATFGNGLVLYYFQHVK